MSCDFIFTRDGKFLIKHIFAFHIIKKIKFIFFLLSPDSNHLCSSISLRCLLHLHWDWDGSPPLLRTARLPSSLLVRSSHWQPHPIARRQHSPTSPDASSTRVHIEFPLIAFTIRRFIPLIAGYGDR